MINPMTCLNEIKGSSEDRKFVRVTESCGWWN